MATPVRIDTNVNVGGITTFQASSITRPANTTAYSALDIIAGTGGTYLTFTNASINGGYITFAKLNATDTGITGDFNVHVFKAESLATYTDNAPLAMTAAEARDNYLGYFTVTVATLGGIAQAFNGSTLRQAFYGGSVSQIICVLQTVPGFPPSANSTVFTLTLGFEQNSEQPNALPSFSQNA